jgi:hypothetical protein
VISVLAALSSAPIRAQEIRIKVLNSRDGRPITNECVNVFTEGTRFAMVVPTNRYGVATLYVGGVGSAPTGAPGGRGCSGLETSHPIVPKLGTIEVRGGRYLFCQEYTNIVPGTPATTTEAMKPLPCYSVARILTSGIAAGNTCGKFRAQAKPGELIVFARPLSLWEKWRSW